MTEHMIQRTGDAPLKISGEQIAESSGRRQGGKDQNRYHDLAVYRTDDGAFAVHIALRQTWEGEVDHDLTRVVRTAGEVAAVFRDYDPTAHVMGFPPGEQFAEKQRRLLADIRRRYEAQISELLAQDEAFAARATAADAEREMAEKRDLRRYRDLLDRALAELDLTEGEACAICDALNGIGVQLWSGDHDHYRMIWAEIADADQLNGLGEKWEIDGQALARRLQESSPLQLCAVADAAERFWREQLENPDNREAVRAVGLVREKVAR